VAADAVLLAAITVDPAYAGGGLGRMLVQGVVRDVSRRGIRAVEGFGRERVETDEHTACLPPADFLRAVGFKTVRAHARTPRLRLDVRSIVSLREDVEYAIEKLFGTIGASVTALGNR
jgi:N-acetylglutamate synthase-like GNAT family acetyltransferase